MEITDPDPFLRGNGAAHLLNRQNFVVAVVVVADADADADADAGASAAGNADVVVPPAAAAVGERITPCWPFLLLLFLSLLLFSRLRS